jgi:hypothetical protein
MVSSAGETRAPNTPCAASTSLMNGASWSPVIVAKKTISVSPIVRRAVVSSKSGP